MKVSSAHVKLDTAKIYATNDYYITTFTFTVPQNTRQMSTDLMIMSSSSCFRHSAELY